MKNFIIKSLIFLLPVLIVSLLLDSVAERGLRSSDARLFQTWNRMYTGAIQADVIINGSSRAWVQVDPRWIDEGLATNSYNIGIDGYPFEMQLKRYEIYKKFNKKPKLIVQSVDIWTFVKIENLYEKEQFIPFRHDTTLQPLLRQAGFRYWDFLPVIPYLSNSKALQMGLLEFASLKHFDEGCYKGFLSTDSEWDESEFDGFIQKKLPLSDPVDPEVIHLFDTFLEHCQRDSVPVVLVYAPQYDRIAEYAETYPQVITLLQRFSHKHGCVFLDYSRDTMGQDPSLFFNAMHLNSRGATLFSRRLAQDLQAVYRP